MEGQRVGTLKVPWGDGHRPNVRASRPVPGTVRVTGDRQGGQLTGQCHGTAGAVSFAP